MARRLHHTAYDYVVIALSPALIMTLVGSLVFFLITVFYQGAFPARLHWVMACFVFAAVLIGRISIEEGLERAMPFGAALAIVVGIAANRFVEYQGSWVDHFGWLINWTLIGVVWWCAHKLTWDCTVIDDAQDASGEGLMQIVGLEGPQDAEAATAPNPDPLAVEGTTSRDVPAGWWQRYVEHQHRPHAPGVWVVYFSLAALPLFGIGQWFIPATATGARRYVFWLLCVYVASGLGLLVTTSFLGLRRYLRQRRIEMPATMSNLWLGTGAVLIGVLLLLATLLPRPSAEYAISQLPITVGSPGSRQSSPFAPDPSEAPDDGRTGQGQAADAADDRGSDDADQAEQSGSIREGAAASQSPEQAQGQPAGATDTTPPADGTGSSNPSADDSPGADGGKTDTAASSSGQAGDSQGESAGGDRQGSQDQDQQGQGSSEPADPDSRKSRYEKFQEAVAARQKAQRERRETQRSDDAQSDDSSKQAGDSSTKAGDGDQQPPDEEQTEEKQASGAGPAAKQDHSNGKSGETAQPDATFQPPSIRSPPLGFLAVLFKWAFYVAFALAVGYFVWRYWEDVLRAIRDFWAGLWGRTTAGNASADDPVAVKVPPAAFSTYADPFATGVAARYPLEELVRYSFEAFEAWSREHGCKRQPEQTPHELARDVARLNAPMAVDARNLAELYSRAAFARGELPDTTRQQLQHAWQTMRQTSDAPL